VNVQVCLYAYDTPLSHVVRKITQSKSISLLLVLIFRLFLVFRIYPLVLQIQELEAANDVDYVAQPSRWARKKNERLRQALALQVELASVKQDLEVVDSEDDECDNDGEDEIMYTDDYEDHSFQHFVDYRFLSDYESH